MEIIASRDFNLAYIIFDCIFLLAFASLLVIKKRYLTILWGLFGGILYFLVDYLIFHLLTHSRSIEGGDMFWTLLWMSMSYGFTNFAWIWLALRKDKYLKEWSLLIFLWWIVCPIISLNIPSQTIHIQRSTGKYHYAMAIILFISYLGAIVYNLTNKDKRANINILRLFLIGVTIQLGWELALLLGGIRSNSLTLEEKLLTLTINSLLETNLGMPLIFIIFLSITSKSNEDLSKNNLTVRERLIELNESKNND